MFSRFLLALALIFSGTLSLAGHAAAICFPGVPCDVNSLVPCGIDLVGSNGFVPDPLGQFTVTVLDGFLVPVVGADVWVDFTACCFDVRLAVPQPGMVFPHQMHALSGAGGVATFRIMGASGGGFPVPLAGCADIWAKVPGFPAVNLTNGVAHPLVQVGTFDLDGALGGPAMGLGPADLSLWLADFFTSPLPYRPRSDLEYGVLCVQNIGPADLARWVGAFLGGGSITNGPGFEVCP